MTQSRHQKIPYTVRRDGTYYFNKRFPSGTLRVSLSTSNRLQAMHFAGGLASFLSQQQRYRMRLAELKLLAADWLRSQLDKHYIRRAHEFAVDDYELQMESEVYGEQRDYWQQCYKVRDYQMTKPIADMVKQKHTIELDNTEQLTLQRLLVQASAELYERLATDSFPSVLNSLNAVGSLDLEVEPAPVDEGELVSVLFNKYSDLKMATKAWKNTRTKNANHNAFKVFLELAGDLPVKRFTKEVARDVAAGFATYPKNRLKGVNAGKTLKELLKSNVSAIDPTTASGHFVKTSAFFKWLSEQGYIDANVFDGLNPVKGIKRSTIRRPWEKEDIPRLFNSKEYLEGDFGSVKVSNRAAYYWAPLIGLYTGARLEEICQLKASDLRQDEGVHYFNIQEHSGDEESSLKNSSAWRRVPINSHLIELGLLEYAAGRAPEDRLFDLTYRNDRWSHNVSIWFGAYKERQGFKKDNSKVFHSFRNTMIRSLTSADIEDSRIMEIVGHEQVSETRRTYDRVFPITQINKAIQQVDWREELALIKSWGEINYC
ncbi:tyrosine-type recombinase/integrase [Dasania sp. GY-MA-18]|uniref:Site-specific integrase n=1 Tax=Dasania phycosphaerae TaxID=2950436 RepID=A0A9J6RN97_9GAMM|nr:MULTISPECIES: site-specific integrase [Dasania]MCR8923569.1 tyrosine-type recombinase/integrase [Dasania sp. GY-MA-18]MCZ0866003.1 site-specific integrase [Dasania phycosphaerae]MCZ0869727.1 site-specific integrase [Dasania phycosphaerae]